MSLPPGFSQCQTAGWHEVPDIFSLYMDEWMAELKDGLMNRIENVCPWTWACPKLSHEIVQLVALKGGVYVLNLFNPDWLLSCFNQRNLEEVTLSSRTYISMGLASPTFNFFEFSHHHVRNLSEIPEWREDHHQEAVPKPQQCEQVHLIPSSPRWAASGLHKRVQMRPPS